MHYFLFIVLPILRISRLCHSIPIPHRLGFQQSLYAYVQVRAHGHH